MNFRDYQAAALRTAGDNPDIRNCQLGLVGEAGEFADLIKKWYFHGHELDKQKALKELGDVLWYAAVYYHIRKRGTAYGFGGYFVIGSDCELLSRTLNLALIAFRINFDMDDMEALLSAIAAIADYLGSSLDEVMQMNIDKLMARYPDGFSAEKSINREDE